MSGTWALPSASPPPADPEQVLRDVGAVSDRLHSEMVRQSRIAMRFTGAVGLFVGLFEPLVLGIAFRNPFMVTPLYLLISAALVCTGALFLWSPARFTRWQIARRDYFRAKWRKLPPRPVAPARDLPGAEFRLRWAQMDLEELDQIRTGLLVLVGIVALFLGVVGPLLSSTVLLHAGSSWWYAVAFAIGTPAGIVGAIVLVIKTNTWTATPKALASEWGSLSAHVSWAQQASATRG